MKFKLVFSGLKVKNMEYAQSLRLTKTSKATSNIKIFGTVFMTWDKIPSQLLHKISMPFALEKISTSNVFLRFSYDGLIILAGRNFHFFMFH